MAGAFPSAWVQSCRSPCASVLLGGALFLSGHVRHASVSHSELACSAVFQQAGAQFQQNFPNHFFKFVGFRVLFPR